jgi:hypothetical protein
MTRRVSLLRTFPIAVAAAALIAGLVAPASVGAWDYTTPKIDFLSEEAMRLINLDRSGNGKSTLYADTKLVNFARDLSWTCPNSSTTTIKGRARDMIDRNYFSHYISCNGTSYSVIDIMKSKLGYTGGRAEIIASSTYGVSATSYSWGCDSSGGSCNGTTTTAKSVQSAVYWWMHSSAHRSIILGDYDRFGCGMWRSSGGKNIFVCNFAKGGPNPLDTTNPVVSGPTGNGYSYSQGSLVGLSASISDNFRLAEGWVRLDAVAGTCSGTTIHTWAYNLNVTSEKHSFTWNTSGVPKGAHTIGWRVRDVATLASTCVLITVNIT